LRPTNQPIAVTQTAQIGGNPMKRLVLPFALAATLATASVAPAAAQTECTNVGRGGAAALVALVNANISGVGVNACDIDVNVLNNSLNNLLQNADIHILENILNRSPILSGNDIDVNVIGNDIVISVLGAGATLPDTITINL
jgi:hypothetical protein